ncbi:unnamed protein product, partial [Ixodes pacificus]
FFTLLQDTQCLPPFVLSPGEANVGPHIPARVAPTSLSPFLFFFVCVFSVFLEGFLRRCPFPPLPRFLRHQLPKTAGKKENDYADHSIYGDDRNADYDDHYRNEDDMHFFPFASSSCPFFFCPFFVRCFSLCVCLCGCVCMRAAICGGWI